MNQKPPGRITKAYARGLIVAVLTLTTAILIMLWGLLGLLLENSPVTSKNVPMFVAPGIMLVEIIVLGWTMWKQTLQMLRGAKPNYALLVLVASLSYLIWGILGTLFGMSIQETWFSLYALVLAIVWATGLALFWAILLRKLYSQSGIPKWPWEDRDEQERRGP